MRTVFCTECEKPIQFKKDLKVSGKLLQPYHRNCIANPKSHLGRLHRFAGCFPTGAAFWALLVCVNLGLGVVIKISPESVAPLAFFTIVFNSVYIFGRISIYYSYERFLE